MKEIDGQICTITHFTLKGKRRKNTFLLKFSQFNTILDKRKNMKKTRESVLNFQFEN